MNERMRGKWITGNGYASDRLYPSLCCIVYWLNAIDQKNTFVSDFKALLMKYPTVNPVLMGFPSSWNQELLWR